MFILGLIAFVGVVVGIILIIINFIKKKDMKKGLIVFCVSFALFVITLFVTRVKKKKSAEEKTAREAEKKIAAELKAKEEAVTKEKAEFKGKGESIPREHKSALKNAELYAKTTHMSKAGIYEQLTSEYGENFPPEAAEYAINNIVFDWKENALKGAQTYAETMNMSDSAIYDQLTSEYGEKFTPAEAQYAIDNLK